MLVWKLRLIPRPCLMYWLIVGTEFAVFHDMNRICVTVPSAGQQTPAVMTIENTTEAPASPRRGSVFQPIALAVWLVVGGALTWLVSDFNRTYGHQAAGVPPWCIFGLFLVSTVLVCWVSSRPGAQPAAKPASRPGRSASLAPPSESSDVEFGAPRLTVRWAPKQRPSSL